MHGGNQSPALFIQHLSRSPVKYLKVRVPGMAVIVSLALWVWVGSGKGLLVVPGDGGLSFHLQALPSLASLRGTWEGWTLVDMYLELTALGLSS